MIVNVPLTKVSSNPWQPRQNMDPAGIEELALSIAQTVLIQAPVARHTPNSLEGDEFQLLTGHRRLEAFELMADIASSPADGHSPLLVDAVRKAIEAGRTFEEIPLDIQDLTDQQMFEQNIQEQIQRADLNPLEIAAAEQRYMKEFNKTSQQAADFFGKSASSIRGDVRLLELPAVAQEKLATGEMTVGVARQLLTIQRVSGPKEADKMAKKLASDGIDTEHIVGQSLMESEDTVEMWSSWRSDESPRAGRGLWLLGTPPKKLPNDRLLTLTKEKAAEALHKEISPNDRAQILAQLNEQIYQLHYQDGTAPARAQKMITDGAPENDIDRLAHLIDPPACSNCLFYAKVEKSHYCGFKACHARKVIAFSRAELAGLVKKMDILAYDPAEDGKGIFALDAGYGRDTYKKIFDDRTDLRLQMSYTSMQKNYSEKHDHTGSWLVRAIVVGKTASKLIDKRKKENAERNKPYDRKADDRRWKIEAENRKACEKLIDLASPIFAPAFAGLGVAPMQALLGHEGGKPNVNKLRISLAEKALSNLIEWKIKEKGPVILGKHLQGIATTWGISLPENWQELAQGLTEGLTEYEGLDGKKVIVSAETEAQ